MTHDYPVYDFATGTMVERPLSAALQVWLDKFCKMFVERWREMAPTEIAVKALPIDSVTFENARSQWSESSVGVPISINQGAVSGMIVISWVDAMILLLEILSETLTERPTERELTSIERSLCQLVLEQAVATWGEAWPDKDALPVELGELDWQPHRSRLFPPKLTLLATGFELATSSAESVGPARMQWFFSKDEMKKLLAVPEKRTEAANPGTTIPIEKIHSVSVEVVATLGTTLLGMEALVDLDVGDIIRLDQPIAAPVTVEVDGRPTFEAWPGRIGKTLCLQIESMLP